MLKGQVYINNVDIATFGASLIRGSHEALLTPPNAKAVITDSSRLQHGYNVVATNMRYDKRDVQLQFYIEGASRSEYLTRYNNFIKALMTGVVSVKVTALNTIYKLVYSSCAKYGNYGEKAGNFVVKMTEYDVSQRTLIDTSKSGNLITS